MPLSVENLHLNYGKKKILHDLSFEVKEGETIALFGPSGAGKTSLLKMIAGVHPSRGDEINFSGSFSRETTALVFQDFWLFPHMNVVDNIAFGLKARKFSKESIKQKINQTLHSFNLVGLEKYFPDQLSGGQKQRVALARAIILEPKLLLLDEPFANLDNHLKRSMREYLKHLQKIYRFSTILVTHDREEAFQLADRMIILLDGKIQQIAEPKEIYFYPTNRKVAEAIGEANFIPGIVKEKQFQTEKFHLIVKNPYEIEGEAELFVPYGTEISLTNNGVPAFIQSSEWTPNGQQIKAMIGDTSCIFTNLSGRVSVEERVYLKFNQLLKVLRK